MGYSTSLNLTQSRRSFIKAAGATLVAGVAAASLGGCAPKAANKNNDAQSIEDISWDEETDVLIVGGGLAGMASAITVAQEGDGASCVILEKGTNPTGSGDSPFSAGRVLWTDDDHAEGFRRYLYELRGTMDNTPDAVLDAFAAGIHENRTWLESLPGFNADDVMFEEHFVDGSGATCYPEYAELPDAYNLGVLWFKGEKNDHVIKFLHGIVQDRSDVIDHKLGARLTALVQDPASKEVVGGVYDLDDKTYYIKARKGVVMCCGGFENNAQMRADYLSGTTARPIAGRMNEGDCHYICARIGTDMWHMNSCAGFWTSVSPIDGTDVTMRTPKKYGITVSTAGRRFFMDWDSDHEIDWSTMSDMTLETNVGSRHGHMQFGGEWPHLPMPETTWYILDADGYAGMMADEIAPAFDPAGEGYGFSADTVEDLAGKLGMASSELVTTINQWNDACDAGNDPYFHRPADTLTPIKKAPFYACHCSATMLNTDGGPRRNEKGQIIDLYGEPVPHLFSAGEFGSVWCNMYNGGGNLGECCAFGRISVRSCLGIA